MKRTENLILTAELPIMRRRMRTTDPATISTMIQVSNLSGSVQGEKKMTLVTLPVNARK